MKLDMLSTYPKSSISNIDQNHLYNANNQFVYVQQQQDAVNQGYMQQRYNELDSYFPSFNSPQQDVHLTCQNLAMPNSSLMPSTTSSSSSATYINLNNKRLKLNINETVLNDNSLSTNNISAGINQEEVNKTSNTMHSSIDFNLIDYSSNVNCNDGFNQASKQFYQTSQSNVIQQSLNNNASYQIQPNIVQQQSYQYYNNNSMLQLNHQQPQQQQFVQLSPANNSFANTQQFDFKSQVKKSLHSSKLNSSLSVPANMTYPITNKKEIEHFEDFISEEDDEEEDDDDDDEEEDDDDFEEEDDMNVLKHHHKKSKKQLDNENDYEIKHNCLTEDGAYMNTLFNSPSSLSSSSTSANNNNQHLDTLNRMSNSVKHYQMNHHEHARGIKDDLLNCSKSKHNSNIQPALVVTKTEMCDDISTSIDNVQIHHQNSLESSDSGSLSSSSSPLNQNLSKDVHNMPKLSNQQQQHINNMINSYSLAGIMNDFDLVNLPLRELNKRLRTLPKQMAYNMKKRRRTLKNRKYAQNCRSKRLEQKSEMEVQNSQLKIEINRLNRLIEKLQKENNVLKCLMSKNEEFIENNTNSLASKDKDKTMISNLTASTNNKAHISVQHNSSSNISQLTHLLSMPLVNKTTNNTNNSLDHFNYHQSVSKC